MIRAGFSGLNSEFVSEQMTQNDALIQFIKLKTWVMVYIQKTPRIPPKGSVIVGTQSLIFDSACPIILGDQIQSWNAFIRVISGEVTIYNSDLTEIPNAYYKGCCIMK